MKERDLVRAKARKLSNAELDAELRRIDQGYFVAASEGAKKRYLTRRSILMAEVGRRARNP